MTSDKRRAKRISVELPVKVYLFDNKGKMRLGGPLAGCIRDFSPLGAALAVATILLNGKHLFYTCQDNPDIILELAFELSGSPEETIIVPAVPVWFDRDLDSDKKQFDVGLKFLANPRSPEIKILSKQACSDETMLVSLWKKFFLFLNYPLFLASYFLFSGGTSG
ncbi:MAG: hypothetical protein AMJ60_00025 [Desulfobacterales bacterium SG8_35]|nr:MAG: hypothetical protein AMJ60_00025 [Desulfobacterales bacterium SG8_35]